MFVVCTRLVVGRTVVGRGVEYDVDSPALPFYEECAPAYAAAHGLGADPQDLGGFDYGRTAYGRRTVPILVPLGLAAKVLILLILAGVFLIGGHPFPAGTLAFGCFFLGTAWLELAPGRLAPARSSPRRRARGGQGARGARGALAGA